MIEAAALTKRYADTLAVDGLSFSVRPGVVTGFLGPNGSGKSTTMRMIMGLDVPSGGVARINGRTHAELRWPLYEVGALLEARAIHPGRSARMHLRMLAETNRIPLRRVDEVLELVGLSAVADRRAGRFSLGMGQRLGIAAALLGDPGVLLFDEPINGLDPDGIRWVRTLLKGFAAEGRTVLVSSHLMSEMALTADDVVVIGRGRLIAETSIAELTRSGGTGTVAVRAADPGRLRAALERAGATVGIDDDAEMHVQGLSAESVGAVALQAGVALFALATAVQSLEDVFMQLTADSVDYRGATPLAGNLGGAK